MKGTIYQAEMSVLFEAARRERVDLKIDALVVSIDERDAISRCKANPETALWSFRKKSDRNKKLKVVEVKNVMIKKRTFENNPRHLG